MMRDCVWVWGKGKRGEKIYMFPERVLENVRDFSRTVFLLFPLHNY